jgi:anti-sigma factor (TIGR02949 family)
MSELSRFDCEATFRRLNDYLDRMLPADEQRLVEEHLTACVACAREYRFEQNVIDHVRGALRRLDVPPDLSRKVSEQLEAAKQQKKKKT